MLTDVRRVELRKEHLVEAERRLNAQKIVPKSPGALNGKEVYLCAGAAVMAAALEQSWSPDTRLQFEATITGPSGTQQFWEVLGALGWYGTIIEEMIKENDAADDIARKNVVVERIHRELARI